MTVGGSVRRRRLRLVRRLGSGLSALELLAPGAGLEDQLGLAACAVEAEAPGCQCSIHRVDPQTGQMADGVGPSLPPGYVQGFVTCGAVWHGQKVIMPDAALEPDGSPCRALMAASGYAGLLAAPVLGSGGQQLGVVLLHTRSPRVPDRQTDRALGLGAAVASVVMERAVWRGAALGAGAVSAVGGGSGGVLAVDRGGRILSAGAAALTLLGAPELVPGQLLEASELPPELREALWRAISGGAEGGPGPADPPGEQRERVLFRRGNRDVEALIAPLITGRGRWYGAMAILSAATEQVRYRQLQESLAANVSHEIRTPLAALSAAVEALHDGLIPADRKPQFLRGILGEIGRLRRLTSQLLEISRLESGTLPVSAEAVRLAPILEGMAVVWDPRCQAAGLELEVRAAETTVVGDSDRVEQVLINLLENAIRHTPPGGRVRVSALKAGAVALIAVSDTGVGIDPEHLPQIWDRFYMSDSARSRSTQRGSGLGLAIVRLLVEQMGGRVLVDSLPGAGSTFSFTLPLR